MMMILKIYFILVMMIKLDIRNNKFLIYLYNYTLSLLNKFKYVKLKLSYVQNKIK